MSPATFTTDPTPSAVADAVEALGRAVEGLDPALLHPTDATRLLEQFVVAEKLAAAGRVLVAQRAAESSAWRKAREKSPEAWLARQQGSTQRQAKDTLTTSERVQGLDGTRAALVSGELSAQQTSLVAAGAAANPNAEAKLLQSAKVDGFMGLATESKRVQAAAERNPKASRIRAHKERCLTHGTEPGGVTWLYAKGPTERMVDLFEAIDDERELCFARARKAGERDTFEAFGFDALMALARSRTDDTEPGLHRARRRKMSIRVDFPAIADGALHDGEICEIPGIGPYPIDAALERLRGSNDLLHLVITRGKDVHGIVTNTRHVAEAIHSAIDWQHPTCVEDGCDIAWPLELDHTTSPTGYYDTQRTCFDELEPRCKPHHRDRTHSTGTHQRE
jgi:hypothetical protein